MRTLVTSKYIALRGISRLTVGMMWFGGSHQVFSMPLEQPDPEQKLEGVELLHTWTSHVDNLSSEVETCSIPESK